MTSRRSSLAAVPLEAADSCLQLCEQLAREQLFALKLTEVRDADSLSVDKFDDQHVNVLGQGELIKVFVKVFAHGTLRHLELEDLSIDEDFAMSLGDLLNEYVPSLNHLTLTAVEFAGPAAAITFAEATWRCSKLSLQEIVSDDQAATLLHAVRHHQVRSLHLGWSTAAGETSSTLTALKQLLGSNRHLLHLELDLGWLENGMELLADVSPALPRWSLRWLQLCMEGQPDVIVPQIAGLLVDCAFDVKVSFGNGFLDDESLLVITSMHRTSWQAREALHAIGRFRGMGFGSLTDYGFRNKVLVYLVRPDLVERFLWMPRMNAAAAQRAPRCQA